MFAPLRVVIAFQSVRYFFRGFTFARSKFFFTLNFTILLIKLKEG